MFCARFVIRTANINHQPAVVAPGNGCLHATTTAFSSVMRIMMIVTLHFVQQPVLAGSSSLFWFADSASRLTDRMEKCAPSFLKVEALT